MHYTYEWANGKGRSTISFNPEKIEIRVRNHHHMYVKPRTWERTVQFVECLEANGFRCEDHPWQKRDDVIAEGFPIDVDFAAKTFMASGNVTCAACACGAGIVAPEGLFYEMFQGKLDYMPESATVLAAHWREETQEGVNPAYCDGLYRLDNVPLESDRER